MPEAALLKERQAAQKRFLFGVSFGYKIVFYCNVKSNNLHENKSSNGKNSSEKLELYSRSLTKKLLSDNVCFKQKAQQPNSKKWVNEFYFSKKTDGGNNKNSGNTQKYAVRIFGFVQKMTSY